MGIFSLWTFRLNTLGWNYYDDDDDECLTVCYATIKENIKVRITGPCERNPPVDSPHIWWVMSESCPVIMVSWELEGLSTVVWSNCLPWWPTQIARFMRPTFLSAPDGPHVDPMNLAIRESHRYDYDDTLQLFASSFSTPQSTSLQWLSLEVVKVYAPRKIYVYRRAPWYQGMVPRLCGWHIISLYNRSPW